MGGGERVRKDGQTREGEGEREIIMQCTCRRR